MGLTVLELEVANPATPDVTEKVEFLGSLTLGALGLSLNPLKRELQELPMILAGLSVAKSLQPPAVSEPRVQPNCRTW